jgi:hypothetical protein
MTKDHRTSYFMGDWSRKRILSSGGFPMVSAFALMLWSTGPATATVYECKGPHGSTILTDRPKGLDGCVMIETLSPSGPGPAPAIPPAVPQAGPLSPLGHEPPAPAGVPPLSVSPYPSSSAPGAVVPNPPSSQSAAPSAPDTQACSSRVNPLNPLATLNCSPSAAPPHPAERPEPGPPDKTP